jgi:hypothetical protein
MYPSPDSLRPTLDKSWRPLPNHVPGIFSAIKIILCYLFKLQAVYQTENLVFVVRHDKELREQVLNVYGTQIERIKQHSKKDVEYNLDLLSRLYEAVKKHYCYSSLLDCIISCSYRIRKLIRISKTTSTIVDK